MIDPTAIKSLENRALSPPKERSTTLRVLDVTDCYSDSVSGGVKTYLHAKMEAFTKAEVQHAVAVPGASTGVETVGRSRLYRLRGPVVPPSPHYRFMLSPSALREVVWQELPHIVEIGSPFIVPWLVRRAVRGRPIKTVGFYHADIVRTFAEPYVRYPAAAPIRVLARTGARQLIRRVYNAFDLTIASSQSVASELRELGVNRVRQVPLGVDLATFHPEPAASVFDRRALGIEEGVPLGIYVGRLCAEKRLDVVLQAHASMPVDVRPHLLFVGGGPHKEHIEALSNEQSRLSVHPYVNGREALAQMYRTADFYLAAGPGETFGLAIAEAMACGLPVVAVNRGAAPDRVRGSGCSIQYTHGDPASCREALRDICVKIGGEARTLARRHAERSFSWTHTFHRLLEVYNDLAGVARGG